MQALLYIVGGVEISAEVLKRRYDSFKVSRVSIWGNVMVSGCMRPGVGRLVKELFVYIKIPE